jgi:predicted dehydrogenase
MMKLRIGLVGLGPAWEKRHRSALRALQDRFEVRAICEEVSHRAAVAAQEFRAEAFDGYQSLTRREDIDAVMVLAPQWYGALPILAACDSGKAIYCAAAMDFTLPQAEQVRQRVKDAGVAFMVEFAHRLAPATLRLKELIATRLGPPALVFCHRRKSYAASSDASTSRELIELVDWCHYVVGKQPTAVFGNAHPGAKDRGEYRMLSLHFGSDDANTGSLAQISCGHYLPETWHEALSFRPPAAMQVSCERGVAFVDLPSTLIWFDEAGRHVESLESELSVGEQLFSQFHRAVTSLVRSTDDLDKAYQAIRIVLAGEESRIKGQRIDLC